MWLHGAPGNNPIVAPGAFINAQELERPKVSSAG